jgi:hypothetical protein
MMKYLFLFMVLAFFICSCSNNKPASTQTVAVDSIEPKSYFPVTSYIKGQLFDIKQRGVSPYKMVTLNGKTDSVILPLANIDSLAQEFVKPEIDSTNLINYYKEEKFLDKSVAAFTFTYDAKSPVADTLPLRHWDVYVEPETGTVKRIYLVKKINASKTLQLTWLHNQWFKTTTIVTDATGNSSVAKEEKINWSY